MNPVDLLEEYAVRRMGELFADAANRHDYDRFAALWTDDGSWEIGRPIDVAFSGRDAIRKGIEEMLGRWDFFVQMPHAFAAEIYGDRAIAYWTMHEIARSPSDTPDNSNVALYLDDLERQNGVWLFKRRRYRAVYQDGTPLGGQSFHLSRDDLQRLYSGHRDAFLGDAR